MSAIAAQACVPVPELETVSCNLCGSRESRDFVTAEDDLTGKPGTFRFVRCTRCGLAYQNPRVPLERIGEYYDDQYIAHRRRKNWGTLTPLFERAMNKLDADKDRLVSRYIPLGPSSEVLDVGCAVGTFLQRLRPLFGQCGANGTIAFRAAPLWPVRARGGRLLLRLCRHLGRTSGDCGQ